MTTAEAIEYFENRKLLLAEINLPGLEACNKALEALRHMQEIEEMKPLVIEAKAVAYIHQMLDEIKHLKPTICTDEADVVVVDQRWIPVTEMLPEEDEQVLCRYVFGEHNEIPFYQVLDYYAFDTHPHFQHEGTNGMCVTHWMPLPEPPEEE